MHPQLQDAMNQVSQQVIGKPKQIKLAFTCLLANGHLLIEDLPGMGKTTLSHALAGVFGLDFSRIQFTSDLLPADMLGLNIFDSTKQSFQFHPGPIFNQLILADEINRASPKTQSALLEAMEEKQVSLDGETRTLPTPFFVIGTQNPMHQSGTYPLPESQLDRFLMRIQLGYPDWQAEKTMLLEQNINVNKTPQPSLSIATFIQMQEQVMKINVSDAILEYILKLVTHSRENEGFPNPLSPRASKALLQASKAWAFLHGRDYVIPEDIQAVLPSVAEHRMRAALSDFNGQTSLSDRLLEAIDPLAA
ncbi:MoxR family ATPase [Aliiglaciecola sp. 3_MG-2023]|uniref:AAA family ATPase n=1 Tax=Aliiglaciecola sp. 3_MG-2023 TaxID=3062644 RepID=UPI0026E412B1|nr:MoxR family ATPase [Aliiglaciecola sp. 3_MG-2023]MDO6695551.1 MoxR family ATPase [Aliiglaciecola sp. 3_MG-2023]